jgi:[protein-PII] uridylyltransferase
LSDLPVDQRSRLTQHAAALQLRFWAEESIDELIHLRALQVDEALTALWREHLSDRALDWALVAVGGYGRGELHPRSDIDILILIPQAALSTAEQKSLELLVAALWDLGLELAHSVRSIAQCVAQCRAEVSVMTSLVEARYLAGSMMLFKAMQAALSPAQVWGPSDFFNAKLAEQTQRHLKANDTAYNLEPNVKTGPGGLRDIQTISWLAKRCLNLNSFAEFVTRGLLSSAELRRFLQARSFLWRVRSGLHFLSGRREDRLLFDQQIALAKAFGYTDQPHTLAVEQLMQHYYRTVLDVRSLSELLLQLLREALLSEPEIVQPLNERFEIRAGSIAVSNDEIFVRHPDSILELYLILQQQPQIHGIRATTLRALSRSLWVIDEEFRNNSYHHELFLKLLRAPHGVTRELRRMNSHGVLGRYLPAFGKIVGRMQYDLFHTYTVDAHTLFVVSHLRRLALPRYNQELPELSRIMQRLVKPEMLYLAALFHDIAKGRGGDHSELGAQEAQTFALQHGLSRYDARLIAWLVRHHLMLSITSQKKDISDPQVINAFARFVGDETHLDYLYVLTCADVRATNPKLWNSWKASLFDQFYQRVRHALRRGLESPLDQEELISETRELAKQLLQARGLTAAQLEVVWHRFADDYFLRHSAEEIAWHTELLAGRAAKADAPLVAVQLRSSSGATTVLIFSRQRDSFARSTAALDQLGLTIVDARISPTGDGFSLALYHVLEDDGAAIASLERQQEIETALWRSLQQPTEQRPTVLRRVPRQVQLFHTVTEVLLSVDEHNQRSVLELIAADRPGLLCDVGRALNTVQAQLQAAKIMTIGARAEDVFYLTDFNQRPLRPETATQLRSLLLDYTCRIST